MTQVQVFIHN